MYLVRDHHDVVFHGDIGQMTQRRSVPRDSDRVVGVGQNQHLAFVVQDAFQIVEIHFVSSARRPFQRIENHLAAVGLRHQTERMIDGRLNYDLVARPSESVDNHADSLYDSRDVAYVVALDVPAVMPSQPVGYAPPISVVFRRISEYGVVQTPLHGVYNEIGGLEIHIGHPHRQQIVATVVVFQSVVLHAMRAAPFSRFVEIVSFHHIFRALRNSITSMPSA